MYPCPPAALLLAGGIRCCSRVYSNILSANVAVNRVNPVVQVETASIFMVNNTIRQPDADAIIA